MANAGVIWDVDGTLVDTAELHFEAWAELCRDLRSAHHKVVPISDQGQLRRGA